MAASCALHNTQGCAKYIVNTEPREKPKHSVIKHFHSHEHRDQASYQ